MNNEPLTPRNMSQESKSDTPETDAQTWKGHCGDGDWGNVVYAHWSQKMERERNEARAKTIRARDFMDRGFKLAADEIARLRAAIRETITENLHLSDGDNCTLKRLKDAIGYDMEDKP